MVRGHRQNEQLTADLGAVQHQVIGLRPGRPQVAAIGHVVAAGRRERVVQRLQPALRLIPAAHIIMASAMHTALAHGTW